MLAYTSSVKQPTQIYIWAFSVLLGELFFFFPLNAENVCQLERWTSIEKLRGEMQKIHVWIPCPRESLFSHHMLRLHLRSSLWRDREEGMVLGLQWLHLGGKGVGSATSKATQVHNFTVRMEKSSHLPLTSWIALWIMINLSCSQGISTLIPSELPNYLVWEHYLCHLKARPCWEPSAPPCKVH